LTVHADTVPSPREVVDRFLRATTGSFDELADLYAPQVTIDMPFAAPLYPTRRQASREELRTQFKAGAASRKYTRVDRVIMHDTGDADADADAG
jgi:hypothetical protein